MSKTFRKSDESKARNKKRNRLSQFKQKYYEKLSISEWYIETPVNRLPLR